MGVPGGRWGSPEGQRQKWGTGKAARGGEGVAITMLIMNNEWSLKVLHQSEDRKVSLW